MSLIAEGYGKAKQQEAIQFIFEVLPIWRKNVARYNLRKSEKTAATERATERATELYRYAHWLLSIVYWLLAIVYCLLAIGYWLLAIGYWLLAIVYWLLAFFRH
jgi:hypothetical protein